MKITIGITATSANYHNYPAWIIDEGVSIIQLIPENESALNDCHAIILTGGIDTHPKFYKSSILDYPNAPKEFNVERDEFELRVFKYACSHKLPILAICRGMQLVNIALGGDILQDIEAVGKNNHHRNGSVDGIHDVRIMPGTLLANIADNQIGIVNSAHHQALGNIAPELIINAWSPDGIAEGTEWKNKKGKPYLLCVQWHPERLIKSQPENPLTKNILSSFLEAAKIKANERCM